MRRIALTIACLLSLGASAYVAPAQAGGRCSGQVQPSKSVSDPTVTGPVEGGIRTGQPYGTTMVPLEKGWIEEEFFVEGTARTYGTPTETEAPFKTRILVRRPTDPADFNGTVILDWNNVTLATDRDVAWQPLHPVVMDRGFVYVSVAAQRVGVEASPLSLKAWDPVRYGSLSHPGDDYSYDIFSQTGEAVLEKTVLGNLAPCVEYRLAMGASQSASRLKTYINEVHKKTNVYDGFNPQIIGAADVKRNVAPVLWVNSMAESSDEGVPKDSGLFRLWEIAGAAHTSNNSSSYHDQQLIYNHSNGNAGEYDRDAAYSWGYQNQPGECLTRNWYQAGYIWSSALVTLDEWVRTGVAPDPMPRIERNADGVVFDEFGMMKGGVRTPIIDVPIASYFAGVSMPPTQDPCGVVGGAIALSGTTRIFTAEELAELYPKPGVYLEKFEAATREAIAEGFILSSEAGELLRNAKDAAKFIAETTGN